MSRNTLLSRLAAQVPATPPARRSGAEAAEEGSWSLSSLDLRDGLEVTEFGETLPLELFEPR